MGEVAKIPPQSYKYSRHSYLSIHHQQLSKFGSHTICMYIIYNWYVNNMHFDKLPCQYITDRNA